MNLEEYIKMSYKRPNKKVLEGLGANEDLIEYLVETPGNTNWNVIGSIGGGSGEITLPYTFHFELKEVEYDEGTIEVPQCTEHDKFVQVIDSFGNGWIPSFEVSNYRQVSWNSEEQKYEAGEIQEFIPTEFVYEFRYTKYGDDEESEATYVLNGKNTLEEQLSFFYECEDGIFSTISIEDITINKQNGYIIKLYEEYEDEGQSIIDHQENRIYLKPGESWTIPGESSETPIYTDGTNNYFSGEVITPTADITLTKITN